MHQVTFRFYGLLNEFLSRGRQLVSFTILFAGRRSVKNAIESVGVPHLKIELIVVNGEPASFDVAIQDGDRIAAFQRSTLSICPAHSMCSLIGPTRCDLRSMDISASLT